jgi:hypothetical protein
MVRIDSQAVQDALQECPDVAARASEGIDREQVAQALQSLQTTAHVSDEFGHQVTETFRQLEVVPSVIGPAPPTKPAKTPSQRESMAIRESPTPSNELEVTVSETGAAELLPAKEADSVTAESAVAGEDGLREESGAGPVADQSSLNSTGEIEVETVGPADKEKSRARCAWLDQRLDQHASWSSDNDIATSSGPAYNTIQRYRSGAASSRDRYVRQKLAKSFRCSIDEVPE